MERKNFFDRTLGVFGLTRDKGITGGGDANTSIMNLFSRGASISTKEAMGFYTEWSAACIRAIADSASNVELQLFKSGLKSDTQLFDHPVLDLLNNPNDSQSKYDLLFTTVAHLELSGNAFLLKDTEAGKPKTLHNLNPGRMEILKSVVPNPVMGYKYFNGNKTIPYNTDQILHFKTPNPNDPYEGIGTGQLAINWLEADQLATEWNKSFFANSARPETVLKPSEIMSAEKLEFLRNSFERLYKGTNNAHKTAVLPTGVEIEKMGWTAKEMDFTEGQRMARDKILAAYGVPKSILGIVEDVNRANAEASNYVFAKRTVEPRVRLLVSLLNSKLLPLYGDNLYFDFVSPVPEDKEAKTAEVSAATAGQPVMSLNEARDHFFGLPPVKGGDNVMQDFNKVPVGEVQEPKENTARPRAAKKKDIASTIVSGLVDSIKEFETQKDVPLTEMSDDDFEERVYKQFASRTESREGLLEKKMQELNEDQKAEVIANLGDLTKAIKPKDVFDVKKWVSLTVSLVNPLLVETYADEASAAAQLIGQQFAGLTKETERAIERSAKLLAQSYNETTANTIAKKLTEAQKLGATLDEVTELVNDVYDHANVVRASMVARTETFRIANAATHDAWEQSGVVKTMKWYTAADERVDPLCGMLHGKTIDIKDKFFDKGDVVTGSDGREFTVNYDDVRYPPLHVNCRCYVRPEEISLKNIKEEEAITKQVDEQVQAQVVKYKEELELKMQSEVAALTKQIDELLSE